VHHVCLDAFQLDAYEVTNADYFAVMPATVHRAGQCATCPADSVSWQQAKDYCEKVGKRLPTEAEWEYAAREGGKPVKYGTGANTISDATANFTNDDFRSKGLKPVGSYPPNALGLYDMAGNVWEWVSDMYMPTYYKVSPEKNPTGPVRGFPYRVVRGGGWHFNSGDERAAARRLLHPTHMDDDVGVRCARSMVVGR
jgi:formylglycine-generating enzyme required for sulfatase activity